MDIIVEHIASLFNFCKNMDKTLPSVRDCKRSASYRRGIGSTIATQVGGPLTDRIWGHLKAKAHGKMAPEYRVPLLVPVQ